MEKKFWLVTLVLAMVAMLVSACDNPPADSGPVAISGAMQKGPLLQGSSLTVSMLDDVGAPTGINYASVTEDDLGTFNVIAQTTGASELIGDGFYYNEIADRLSGAPITLRAIYKIMGPDPQQAYLNVFTHLSSGLAKKRLAEGDSVDEAVAYAENALFGELNSKLNLIHPLGALEGNGTEMNLTDPTSPDNQWVMALSCIIANSARLIAIDDAEVDAKLQMLLNDIRSQMQSTSESISDTYINYLRAGEASLDPIGDCVDNLANYLYNKTGEEKELPDADQVADNDGDGIPNADDPDIDGDGILNEDDEAPYNANVGGGMYFDYSAGLAWENVPLNQHLYWSEAQSYCQNLALYDYNDWRMPTINELRSLIRGCPDTETGGPCGVTNDCASQSCYNSACEDPSCPVSQGPGINGFYQPIDMGVNMGIQIWSVTTAETGNAWVLGFARPGIYLSKDGQKFFVRCVRTM